ncbi:MAG: autotransporter domain-containing protein [Thalassococcus sp.]|uniref:autotransporter domain-containing protein n=1 Tax=Thalassococcus sp. TaxID=1928858 RepID=UPI001B150987|nr:autotransporter domain-containing protein [Thalassococcus sp.]MBO6866097.1 autotransporter domain-containing protein [Thalassococcus sp.]
MKSLYLAAAIAVTATTPLYAQDGPPGGPPGGLPPGVLGQINLGKAGLLGSFYSNDAFGTAQFRIGQGRSTIGAAEAPFAPQTGYEDGASNVIVPLNALKMLPDGKSYLRFGLELNWADGSDEMIELNGDIARLDVQYLTFPNVNTMLSIGAFYNKSDLEIVGAGTVKNDGYGLRADVLHKFAPNWGVASRIEYAWGETELEVEAGLGMTLRHVQGDDRLYFQTEVIGAYTSDQIAGLGSWVFHPTFGMNFQRNFIEETTDSFGVSSSGVVGDTEDYGAVWAVAQFEKEAPPGQWSPSFKLGLEHEYANDLDHYVEDRNSAILGVGLSHMDQRGNRVDLSYTRHHGLEGKRYNQALVAAFTVNF